MKKPRFTEPQIAVALRQAEQGTQTANGTEREYLSVKLDDPSFAQPILRQPGRGRGRPAATA
jgi:uncharacterized protein (DUF736 family)